jgi:CPA2 family monovalent cation:H+ antiporter-2
MHHLPNLIIDLALILGSAGITTIIFRRLKQPMVLGYIIAGLLVGPNFNLFPTISEIEGIKIWAEIGVIFLLFALGLEFSFKKLAKVGGSAAITGIWEISIMLTLGFFTGRAFGWSTMDSMFLGGIIAISSTTIIFRAFEELGLKTRNFTSLVMGVLIVEDLVAILLLVLLSTLGISKAAAGSEMLYAFLKLGFFLCLWFLMGIFLLPSLLKQAAKWLTNEILLIGAIALCLGMVVLADSVGFSAALGAFVMGSILSETIFGEKIVHLIDSVKNLFGAIFFVSVGMLIDPALLGQNIGPVLILTAIVIVGKLVNVTTGALISGRPLREAVQAGTSMTQIGEFSFIIATLGVSLKVTNSYLYPIAVGVSVITTFTTPYLIRLSEPLLRLLEKILPAKWLVALNRYSAGSQILRGESDWQVVIRQYAQIILLNTVMAVAIISFSELYLKPWFDSWFDNWLMARLPAACIALAAIAPFVWAIMAKKIQRTAYKALWLDNKYNRGPLLVLEVFRNLWGVLLVGILLGRFFPFYVALGGTVVFFLVVIWLFKHRVDGFYHRLEARFIRNLNQKEQQMQQTKPITPWDAHLTKVKINPSCRFIGEPLEQLRLREQFGINIAFIERGSRLIYAPKRTERLYPFDEIGVIGTDMQLQKFTRMVEAGPQDALPAGEGDAAYISLEKVVVNEHNALKGLSIRSSAIREKTNGLVVGIERAGERIINPSSDTIFEWGDIIWLVGDRRKIDSLNVQ